MSFAQHGDTAFDERATESSALVSGKLAWIRRHPLCRAVGAVIVITLLSAPLLIWLLRLQQADPRIPFIYDGDALPFGMLIKGLIENGWHLHNDRVGAPFGLDVHDYPMADNLHFIVMKLCALFCSDYGAVLNLFFLLGFPLTALSAYFVFRHFGISAGPALVGCLLYEFLPFHFLRLGHSLLAAYYLVPWAVMLALWIHQDKVRNRAVAYWLAGVVICLLLASGGVYYAFFACFFFFLVGTEAGFQKKCPRPFGTAAFFIGVVVFGLFLNGLPALVYRLGQGANPDAVARGSFESEHYGLKIMQLLLPIRGHRIYQLARFRESYHQTAPLNNENETSSLGLLGSLGFLGLLGGFLLRRRAGNRDALWDALGLMTLGAVLLATVGGLGSLFSCLAARWLRGYNRISVFIAFFALFGVVLFLDWLASAFVTSRKARCLYYGLLLTLLVIGLLDQTSPTFAPPHAQLKAAFQADAAFIADLEARLPEHALVFQLPYIPFPEGCSANRKLTYDHLRGYLHSRTLRWSYAVMKGRPGDRWQRQFVGRPTSEMLSALAFAEFDGLFVDRLGFDDHGREMECQLTTLLGSGPLVSPDGRFAFFDLMSFREKMKRGYSAEEWQMHHEAALSLDPIPASHSYSLSDPVHD